MAERNHGCLFVSYARADGEDHARWLVDRIQSVGEGLSVRIDRDELQGGSDWRRTIINVIEDVEFLILVLTPAAVASAEVRWEWLYARARGVCVVPVQVDAGLDCSTLPTWMAAKHVYDLTVEWDTFVNHVTRPCQAERVAFMAPPPPADYLPRRTEEDDLRRRLLSGEERAGTVAISTSLQGAGGYGKTTLATAMCYDDHVLTAFDDGVLWVTLGRTPNIRRALDKLHRALTGERSGAVDVEGAARDVADRLRYMRAVLVIDDVWRPRDLRWFMPRNDRCARTITTRHFDVALAAGVADRVVVDEMRASEAVRMLTAGIDVGAVEPSRWISLVERLGEWPLLIKLARGVLQKRIARGAAVDAALEHVTAALNRRGLVAFDAEDATERDEAAALSVQVSLDQLRDADAVRWAQLAVFPEDTSIPIATAGQLWGLDPIDADEVVGRLGDLSLIDLDLSTDSFTVHDVLLAVAEVRVEDLTAAHGRLVDAWGDWRGLPDGDRYAWMWIGYHLHHAGRDGVLREALLDGAWLTRRVRHGGVASVLGDCDRVAHDPDVLLLADAIRLSAHVLHDHPGQLASQLLARLEPTTSPTLSNVFQSVDAATDRPWLRPERPTLDAPGGPLLRTLTGHTTSVHSVAVSPDGRRAVTGGELGEVMVWDMTTGHQLGALTGHSIRVTGVAVYAAGDLAITGSLDGTVRVWDLVAGREVSMLDSHAGDVTAVAVTPDERHAISCCQDGTATVWDLSTGTHVRTLQHAGSVSAVVVTPDGCHAVTGSGDRTVRVWDLATGKVVRELVGHADRVHAVAVTPDGRQAVTGSHDGMIHVWDLGRGTLVRTLTGSRGFVMAVAVTPDGRLVVSGSSDETVKVWRLATGELLRSLAGHTSTVNAVAVTPDSRMAISGSSEFTVKVWDLVSETPVPSMGDRTGTVSSVAVTPDGGHAVTGSWDHTLCVWDVSTGREARTLAGHTDSVYAVAVTPDGRHVVSGSRDCTVRVWELATGSTVRTLTCGAPVLAIDVTPEGHHAIVGLHDHTVTVLDLASGGLIGVMVGHTSMVNCVAVTPDGRRAISGSSDGTLRVWDLASGAMQRTLTSGEGSALAVAVTPDGRHAIGGWEDGTATVWNMATGAQVHSLSGPVDSLDAVAVTRDSRHVVTSVGRLVSVWSLATGEKLTSFTADGLIYCLATMANHVVAAGATGRLHVLGLVVPC